MSGASDASSLIDELDDLLMDLAGAIAPDKRRGPGRPAVLAHAIVWTALVLGVLRGMQSQLGVWRVITRRVWAGYGRVVVSDQAVYNKLGTPGPSPVGHLFRQITDLLFDRDEGWHDHRLAPFAAAVVAIDEMALDTVPRTVADLWGIPAGDRRLLPGKIACRFDLRRQLFREVRVIDAPQQNEKVAAWDLIADLAPGTLVVADLGYFGFRWFDTLTERGLFWLSRERRKSSVVPVHTFYRSDQLIEELVWLGAHRADRAKHLVRRITITRSGASHTYYTNVLDPRIASARSLVDLYGRRWDIELAFKHVKRDLKLHDLWSAKPAVIAHQLWAVLLIAQVLSALRGEIAGRAEVSIDAVSLPLMVQYLPEYARTHPDDPIGAFVADGVFLRFIRPASRARYAVADLPPEQLHLPPPDLARTRTPRYAGKM
jgi:hypothetical protein